MDSAVQQTPVQDSQNTPLLSLAWDDATWSISISINLWLLIALAMVFAALFLWRLWAGGLTVKSFEIDQAEIGVGNSKFRFKPNLTDRQVAYAIWVELSTRKIGLPIDLDHDVVSEIYDSWYEFFGVTRDLIKGIPVSRIKRDSTQAIIKLSVEVLNEGLRPHLTQWQARFRQWYARELKRNDQMPVEEIIEPQQLQAKFPHFEELRVDLERVNRALMRYRAKMRELVMMD